MKIEINKKVLDQYLSVLGEYEQMMLIHTKFINGEKAEEMDPILCELITTLEQEREEHYVYSTTTNEDIVELDLSEDTVAVIEEINQLLINQITTQIASFKKTEENRMAANKIVKDTAIPELIEEEQAKLRDINNMMDSMDGYKKIKRRF